MEKPFKFLVTVEGQGDTPKCISENIQTLPDLWELISDLGDDVIIQSKEDVEFRYLKIINDLKKQ